MKYAAEVLVLCWCAVITALPEQPTFRSDVSVVSINAEVTDGTRLIDNLRKEDFQVWDNETPQEILDLRYATEPLDVVLLFDVSGSMRPNIERITASAETALAELHSDDRVAVMVFAAKSRVLLGLTDNLAEVAHTLQEDLIATEYGGSTRLLAAIADATKLLASDRASRRRGALLVFTDNYGLRTRRAGPIITRLWEMNVTVSGLFIRNPQEVKIRKVTRFVLPTVHLLGQGINRVVADTGGDIVEVQDRPSDVFRELMQRLHNRYTLYYLMPKGKPGENRNIRIGLSEQARTLYPNGRIRARKAYRVPAE